MSDEPKRGACAECGGRKRILYYYLSPDPDEPEPVWGCAWCEKRAALARGYQAETTWGLMRAIAEARE